MLLILGMVAMAVAGSVVVIVSVVSVVRAGRRASAREIERLRRDLGLPATSPLVVERHGRAFTAEYVPAGKIAPPSLKVTPPVDETAEIVPATAYRALPETGRPRTPLRPAILFRASPPVGQRGGPQWRGAGR
jgi:hypothetical protein